MYLYSLVLHGEVEAVYNLFCYWLIMNADRITDTCNMNENFKRTVSSRGKIKREKRIKRCLNYVSLIVLIKFTHSYIRISIQG